jgi:hypothetical protein
MTKNMKLLFMVAAIAGAVYWFRSRDSQLTNGEGSTGTPEINGMWT